MVLFNLLGICTTINLQKRSVKRGMFEWRYNNLIESERFYKIITMGEAQRQENIP